MATLSKCSHRAVVLQANMLGNLSEHPSDRETHYQITRIWERQATGNQLELDKLV